MNNLQHHLCHLFDFSLICDFLKTGLPRIRKPNYYLSVTILQALTLTSLAPERNTREGRCHADGVCDWISQLLIVYTLLLDSLVCFSYKICTKKIPFRLECRM